jgi:hypothetical protein
VQGVGEPHRDGTPPPEVTSMIALQRESLHRYSDTTVFGLSANVPARPITPFNTLATTPASHSPLSPADPAPPRSDHPGFATSIGLQLAAHQAATTRSFVRTITDPGALFGSSFGMLTNPRCPSDRSSSGFPHRRSPRTVRAFDRLAITLARRARAALLGTLAAELAATTQAGSPVVTPADPALRKRHPR